MSATPSLQLVTTWPYLHDTLRETPPTPDHLAEHANCSKCWDIRFLKSAAQGDLEDVQRCLDQGADPNSVDENGWIAVRYSTYIANRRNALHLALLSNKEHVVRYLSEHHRSLAEGVNSKDEPPFLELVKAKKISEFSWNCLMSARAILDFRSSSGRNALHHLATEKQNTPYLKKMIDHLKAQSHEFKVVLSWMPTVLLDLIHSYFTIFNDRDQQEKTPLDYALFLQNEEGVRLLKQETDLTLKNRSGITLKERVENFEKALRVSTPSPT